MTNPVFNQIDHAVIARMRAGIRHEHKPVKKLKPKRAARSYRAARRNDVLRGDTPYIWEGVRAKVRPAGSGDASFHPNGDGPRARRARQIAAGQLRAENGVVA